MQRFAAIVLVALQLGVFDVAVATAQPTAPTVESPTSTAVGINVATLGGDVTSQGSAPITARGIVYAPTPVNANPQLGGAGVFNVPIPGSTGVFSVVVPGLVRGAAYSFKAYATNSAGTSYSPVATFDTIAPGALRFTNSTPLEIPDNSTNDSTIVVSGAHPQLRHLNLQTFLRHTWMGDLDITLTSPAGTTVRLVTDIGMGPDDVFNGTVWDDTADPSGQVPYAINPRLVTDAVFTNLVVASPLVPEGAFGAFLGEDPNGTWTLHVADDATQDVGTLDSWSLLVTAAPSAPSPPTASTFDSSGSVAIPAGPAVVTSQIAVAGLTAPLVDLEVETFLTHTASADIDMTLTSPSGTVVTLTTDNGGSHDNVFNGTLWDDDGVVPATDHVYVNLTPATSLIPEEAMSAFLGEDPNGLWTLRISDDAPSNGGSLSSWNLRFKTPVVPTSGEVAVAGNAVDIPDGAAAPSAADHTDFGSVGVGSGSVTRTFTITNPGASDLSLFHVAVLGPAGHFSVTAQPASLVPSGGNTTFQVTFDPSAIGVQAATLVFASSDADENPFEFAVQGAGVSSAPGVTAPTSSSVFATVAVLGGQVTSDGGDPITARGIVYAPTAVNPNPELGGPGSVSATTSGTTGVFTVNVTGLSGGTAYTFKAYATNALGTGYSPASAFTTVALLDPAHANTSFTPLLDPGTTASTIVVSGAEPFLRDVDLQTFLRHPRPDNLDITLTSPAGTVVTVTTDNGGTFANVFNGTIWNDSADPGGQLPYTNNPGLVTDRNSYVANVTATPLVPEGAFGAFAGEDPNGTWTLSVTDDASANAGSLDAWSLKLTTSPSAPASAEATFDSSAPVEVPGATTVTSQITISGAPGPVLDLNVRTFLRHTYSEDLDVTLVSPQGTVVTLTTDNGPGLVDIFNGTLWDDDGAFPTTDNVYTSGVPAPSLVPEEALAAFNGEDPNGIWTLTVADAVVQDSGWLDSWSLILRTEFAPAGEIAVSGNAVDIADGDATPDAADGTDFGNVPVAASVVRSFTIANSAAETLSIGLISFSGAHAADFAVTTPPASSIATGASTTFQVTFTPGGSGLRSATLRIPNSDADEYLFDFAVHGTGLPGEVSVSGNATGIEDGDGTPSAADHTDFEGAPVGGSVVRVFTIANAGPGLLNVGSVGVGGANAGDFAVTAQPASPVAAGASTTFQVTFTPSGLGLRSAALSFTNDDPDESPFDFAIQGTGEPSTNADLASLTLSRGALSPTFSPATLAYATELRLAYSSITVTPTAAAPTSTIQVRANGGSYAPVASGSASGPLALAAGANLVELLVTAEDGTTTRSYAIDVTLTAMPGDRDASFAHARSDWAYALALQPDGKLWMGGESANGGVPLARLASDGTVDVVPADIAGTVNAVSVLPGGRVLVGGTFSIAGVPRNIARLNADGTWDASYTTSADNTVLAIRHQPDGNVLVAGYFSTVNGTTRVGVARLTSEGVVDESFDAQANAGVVCLELQPNGDVILGGTFNLVRGTTRNYVARVHPDGTLDGTFDPNANGFVLSVALQPDGRILLGGNFTTIGSTGRVGMARLSAAGVLESGFDPSAANMHSIAPQADGKILIAGIFTSVAGQPRGHLARLLADGSLDPDFLADADQPVLGLALQADGKVVAAGQFTQISGTAQAYVARLVNDAAEQSLSAPRAGRVLWLRGAASPEVSRTTFELSTDGGATYAPLGAGTRVAGTPPSFADAGWELSGLALPSAGSIRARGFAGSGAYNGSSGLFEATLDLAALAPPEVAVSGNGVEIADGDVTPDAADHTEFGTSNVALVRTFTISNSGSGVLDVSSVGVSGPHAALFTVTAQPAALVDPGQSTTFQVTFQPLGAGVRDATLTFTTSDFDEQAYDFAVQGTAVLSTDASLAALTLSSGAFDPPFSPGTLAYAASLRFAHASVSVTPTTADPFATIQVRVNGGAYANVASGTSSAALPLNAGSNVVDVLVTAQDTSTSLYSLTLERAAQLDPDFAFDVNGNVEAVTVQPDGAIVIAGSFSEAGGQPRDGVARLLPDGTLDAGFAPNGPNGLLSVSVLPDGKLLLAGMQGVSRVNADGSPDASFGPVSVAGGFLQAAALQGDGSLVIGGYFTSVNGVPRQSLARLMLDGSVDPGFDPNPDLYITALAIQGDQILVGGNFTSIGGTTVHRFARLDADGTLDTSFTGYFGYPEAIALQPDGKILVGGVHYDAGGTRHVARFDPNGAEDATFDAAVDDPGFDYPSGRVQTVVQQADGKILIAGNFLTVGGAPHAGLARLNSDGSVDPGFTAQANATVRGLALQPDGRFLAVGAFTQVDGTPRSHVARIDSAIAVESLSIPNAGRIEWTLGALAPASVTFEVSNDAGFSYYPVGNGTYVGGVWELTSIGLPPDGQIRARTRITGGLANASSSPFEAVTTFSGLPPSSVAPDIAVYGNATEIPSGDTTPDPADGTDFGLTNLPVTRTFTVANVDAGFLALGPVSVTGPDAASFLTGQPSSLLPNNSFTTFEVTFTPSGNGLRSATIQIPSNDPDEAPFEFALQGTAFLSTDASLSALTLNRGVWAPPLALTPPFDSSTLAYSANVPYSAVALTATATDATATILVRVNGVDFATPDSGTPTATLPLVVGANDVDVIVTAQDGTTVVEYSIDVTRAAAQPGDTEPSLDLSADDLIIATAVQPDGKVLLGGYFSSVAGENRNYLARINADGTLDGGFSADVDDAVFLIAVQPDGKILVGGAFENVGGVPRHRMARLNADGSLDTSFDHGVYWPSTFSLLSDGKLLVGASYPFLSRLNPDGSHDGTFGADLDGDVYNIAPQANGKIVISGVFGIVGGLQRIMLARLNADGSVDPSFDAPMPDDFPAALAVQQDGKVLLAGAFSSVGGTPRPYLARLNEDGTLDAAFEPQVDNAIPSIALQADGKIVVAGDFTAVGGTPQFFLARLLPDGSLDATFAPVFDWPLHSVVLQADGSAFVAGIRPSSCGCFVDGTLARVYNHPASQSVEVPDNRTVRWIGGGTSPDVTQVLFEVSTDGGTTKLPLAGTLTRVGPVVELTNTALPESGFVYAQGLTVGGFFNGAGGIVQAAQSFAGLPVPEVAVTGNGVDVADGAATPSAADHTDFGAVYVDGGSVVRTFTITNSGPADLWLGNVTIVGSADFSVLTQPVSPVAAGGSTTLQIAFDPSSDGLLGASVRFTTSDFGESPFDFAIQGTGLLKSVLTINDVSVTEGNSGTVPLTFLVTRSAPTDTSVTVQYSTAPGNASDGPDYVGVSSGSVSFAEGETEKPVTILVKGDTLDEPNEAFLVTLHDASPNAVILDAVGQGTILDDDGKPALCQPVASAPFVIGAAGKYCLVRNLSYDAASGAAISIESDDVMLDLNGYEIAGTGNAATLAIGVRAVDRQDVVLRNGSVRGFLKGVSIENGGSSRGHVVRNLRAIDNTYVGLWVEGGGSTLRNNLVLGTGGTTAWGPNADVHGIVAQGFGLRVRDNDAIGTTAVGTAYAVGIDVYGTSALVERNRVSNQSIAGGAIGIRINNGTDALVTANRLLWLEFGILFQSADGKYQGNLTVQVATPYTDGTPAGNNQ